jgi:hypothetical protein
MDGMGCIDDGRADADSDVASAGYRAVRFGDTRENLNERTKRRFLLPVSFKLPRGVCVCACVRVWVWVWVVGCGGGTICDMRYAVCGVRCQWGWVGPVRWLGGRMDGWMDGPCHGRGRTDEWWVEFGIWNLELC